MSMRVDCELSERSTGRALTRFSPFASCRKRTTSRLCSRENVRGSAPVCRTRVQHKVVGDGASMRRHNYTV